MSLPAMSTENVEAFEKRQAAPVLMRSTSESAGGLEHLDNLYKLMEHLGHLRRQNTNLQKRVQYLEHMAQEEPDGEEGHTDSRRKRSAKCKSGGYGIRHSLMRGGSRERSRSVGVEEIAKAGREGGGVASSKSKVSKWTKVKEAFRWERASATVLLPDAASQDSGLGGGDYRLRVPSDQSSFSVSPADSVLSGQSSFAPQHISSTSTSEDELELDVPFSDSGQKRSELSIEGSSRLRAGHDDDDIRRSKSLEGDSIVSPTCSSEQHNSSSKECKSSQHLHKSHKTPWSKVKDIIQTRTGSIKKKKGVDSDLDEDAGGGIEICTNEDNRECEERHLDLILDEAAMDPNLVALPKTSEVTCKKRLAPVLTITLPSTEELRTAEFKSEACATPAAMATPSNASTTASKVAKPPPSPQVEEKHHKCLVKQKTLEDAPQKDQYRKQVSSSSAGTSPPTPRRQSKWSKVKNAFLTSTPSPEDLMAQVSNSIPSSPVKCSSFLYDLESDELSSGEYIDDNMRDNNDDVFPESLEDSFSAACGHEHIHSEIQRNFEELQLRLSNEFHQKLSEWERIKNSGTGIGTPPSAGKISASGLSSGTSSVGEDDKGFRRKVDEWDKIKSTKKRESVALQQLGEENLTPDFKKKLEQWEKLKSIPLSPTPDSSPTVQPQLKKKITEWQRWRPGGSSMKGESHAPNTSPEIPEEFSRKLLEWERLKQVHVVENDPLNRTGNRSPSPGMSRKDYVEQKYKKSHQRFTETKEKWSDTGHKVMKSKSHHEMKELAWLEKELHKIEREKQRLERERDKYLEREARLEKMRRAIGSTQQKQEVVIPTSTGIFRFEGISQKFTKKLYEWEKARGIGPEASTIALLDPGYQPSPKSGMNSGETLKKNGTLLLRSKSVGSVVDVASSGGCSQSTVITHQPSSLSLNNVEELENAELVSPMHQESQGDLCMSEKEYDGECEGEELGAVIVDVEDVVEETASPLAEQPAIITETPVYCYAPEEVTRLIDSSGSDNELGSEGVQSSYIILQENISLLDKLKKKEDICRKIECEMEDLEEKMHNTAVSHEQQLESLERVEPRGEIEVLAEAEEENDCKLQHIKAQLRLLEKHQEALRHEEETLQYSFVEHSEQQAILAQNLVDKMRQLHEVNSSMSSKEGAAETDGSSSSQHQEALAKVHDLTTQLLTMAERLEIIVGERNKELWKLREAVISSDQTGSLQRPALSQPSFSTDSIMVSHTGGNTLSRLPRQSSEELSRLPAMLTSKVLELKRGLTYLCAVSDSPVAAESLKEQTADCNPPTKKTNADCNEGVTTYVVKFGCQTTISTRDVSSRELSQSKKIRERTISELKGSEDEGSGSQVASFTFSPPKLKKTSEKKETTHNEKKDKSDEVKSIVRTYRQEVKQCGYEIREDKNTSKCEKKKLSNSTIFNYSSDDDSCSSRYIQETSKALEQVESTKVQCEESATKKIKRIKRQSSGDKLSKTADITSKSSSMLKDNVKNEHCSKDDTGTSNSNAVASGKKVANKNNKPKKVLKRRPSVENEVGNTTENSNSKEPIIDTKRDLVIHESAQQTGASSQKESIEHQKRDHRTFSEKFNLGKSISVEESPSSEAGTSLKLSTSPSESNVDQVMRVNVFVPTTRKIFSPVRRDSKGKASSVISYVVKDTASTTEQSSMPVQKSTSREGEEDSETRLRAICTQEQNKLPEDVENKKEEINFVMPPCWILRETRAQSASPALQRRHFPVNRTRESQRDHADLITPRKRLNRTDEQDMREEKVEIRAQCSADSTELPRKETPNNSSDSKLNVCKTPPLPKRDKICNRDNSSSESSTEKSNSSESKLQPIRKSRTEVGFPPISPIPGRRDLKLPVKETAPSIRMIIARYNQRVTESQELIGTKSPDSGNGSPVPWRSPGAERRVKAQMERYQEEVRRALQGTGEKRRGFIGEVKKSASASFIRTWDKGGLNDGFNRRPSDGLGERQISSSNYHGILKSSSAGSIKPTTPIPTRHDEVEIDNEPNETENQTFSIPSTSISTGTVVDSTLETDPDPPNISLHQIGETQEREEQIKVSKFNPQSSPESTRLRALRIKKAKEEFLSRGPGGESWGSECKLAASEPSTSAQEEIRWPRNKNRLSQVSCESECSCEGILVSGEEQRQALDSRLLVKSASAGMINVESSSFGSILPESASNSSVPSGACEQGAISKSRFGFSNIASRFRKVRMRRHRDKEKEKMETVSALCRQSLLVDIQKNRSADRKENVPSSKSCPSSPVLQKRDSSWSMNPRKIFRPK